MLFKLSTQYCFRCSSAYNYVLVVHLLLKVRVVRREKSYILFSKDYIAWLCISIFTLPRYQIGSQYEIIDTYLRIRCILVVRRKVVLLKSFLCV